MPHSKDQLVFPFLADDPIYLRDLREERIIEEMKEDLTPVLRAEMIKILRELATSQVADRLETLVTEAVEDAIKDVRSELRDISRGVRDLVHRYERSEDANDPADWWKRGTEPGDDEEHPF